MPWKFQDFLCMKDANKCQEQITGNLVGNYTKECILFCGKNEMDIVQKRSDIF